MRRRDWLLVGFSLAASVVVAVFWYRSREPDVLHWTTSSQRAIGVISGHGTLDLLYIAHWPQEPEFRTSRYDSDVYYGTRYSKRWLGFGYAAQLNGGKYVNVPHWFLMMMAAAPATWVAFRRRVRLDEPAGAQRCTICGYDLRASPDRCPECGTTLTGGSNTVGVGAAT